MNAALTSILYIVSTGFAWSQNFEWAKSEGSWAYDFGYGITTDNSGNVFLAGKFEREANFSGTVVPCVGNHDIFLARYSPAGSLIWVRTAGGNRGDFATSVATNGSYVYIAGEIQGTDEQIIFSGSSITLTAQGSNDIFIAKYDLDGNLFWARRAGGSNWDKAYAIDCDDAGNVYIAGEFTNTAVFGDSTTVTGYGGKDIVVAKYDPDGNFLWLNKAGGVGVDGALSVKVDASGDIYVCGFFKDTADFSGTQLISNGISDIYLAKYAANGDLLWVKTAGGYNHNAAWAMTIGPGNKIFLAGEFKGIVDFGGHVLTSSGNADVFVLRYDTDGNVEWAVSAGGIDFDRAKGMGSDENNIFITGQYGGTAAFGSSVKTAVDSSDIFISALDSSGNFLWTSTVGGEIDSFDARGYESGESASPDGNGNLYVSGNLLNGGSFGGIPNDPYSRTDIFITKLKYDAPLAYGFIKEKRLSVSMYPNPVKQGFTLRFPEIPKEDLSLNIFDITGSLIRESVIFDQFVDIDVSALVSGIYLVGIKSENEIIYKEKFIVQE